jgi:rhodanese-related sulfurtransferase
MIVIRIDWRVCFFSSLKSAKKKSLYNNKKKYTSKCHNYKTQSRNDMKDFITKKHIYEIIIIIATSVLLGLVYNALNPKKLPLIYKPAKIEKVSNDELFGPAVKQNQAIKTNDKDTIVPKETEQKPVLDTLKNTKAAPEEKPLSKTIVYSQMLKIIGNPDFIILDARNAEDFAQARIGNAINIFPYDATDVVLAKAQKLPMNKKIIVYCEGGDCDSSHKLGEILDMMGFDKVYFYSGGWEDWIKHKGGK